MDKVTLSTAYGQSVPMSYRPVDRTARTGTLTSAPGETTKIITIEVTGDRMKEADEAFYLDLFGNSNDSLFTRSRGTGTIPNDD
jgi:hypothetical protein